MGEYKGNFKENELVNGSFSRFYENGILMLKDEGKFRSNGKNIREAIESSLPLYELTRGKRTFFHRNGTPGHGERGTFSKGGKHHGRVIKRDLNGKITKKYHRK